MKYGWAVGWLTWTVSAQLEDRTSELDPELGEVWNMSIEDLMNVPIVTASKSTFRFFDVPAAVSVLQGDALLRTGAPTLMDGLRYVPGMNIASGSGSVWSVAIRGIGGRFSNKLLVLKDGRSLYSPTFSGVFWDSVDGVFEDIDRIEIVRGPGSATWGVNAMNGVINILTRPAFETTGGLVSAGIDHRNSQQVAMRYGWRLGDDSAARVYYKHRTFSAREGGFDHWQTSQIGIRSDHRMGASSRLMIQAEAFQNRNHERFYVDDVTSFPNHYSDSLTEHWGSHVMGHWTRELPTGEFWVKAYAEFEDMHNAFAAWERYTYDLELALTHEGWERHKLSAGLGMRYSIFTQHEEGFIELWDLITEPKIANLFVEDEIQFSPSIRMQLGSKFEYLSDFVGFVYEPRVRVSYQPSEHDHWWVGISRAVRAPSLGELALKRSFISIEGIETPGGTILNRVFLEGVPDALEPEESNSFEVGYRSQITELLVVDATLFYNDYRGVISYTLVPEISSSRAYPLQNEILFRLDNVLDFNSHGFEISLSYRPGQHWRTDLNWSYLTFSESRVMGDDTLIGKTDTGENAPTNSGSMIIHYLPSQNLSWFAGVRYVQGIASAFRSIKHYIAFDFGVHFQYADRWTISLSGQNLFDDQHLEYDMSAYLGSVSSEVERQIWLRAKFEF